MKQRASLIRWLPLFLIVSLGLFLELSVVRWVSAEIRLFSYFKNLPLLAAFLGLAIGYSTVGKGRDYQPTFAPLLLLYIGLTIFIGRFTSPRALVYPSTGDDFLWFTGGGSYWAALFVFISLTLLFFLLTLLLFVPLGQAAGEEMARHQPVPAYIVNLLASLAGIWLFALFSFLETPPLAWFGAGVFGLLWYWKGNRKLTYTGAGLMLSGLAALLAFQGNSIWSPYQRLELVDLELTRQSTGEKVKVGKTLQVQQVFYQTSSDLSPDFVAQFNGDIPELEALANYYNFPYQFIPPGAEVLIVGAGMGNDAAAALRNGVGKVTAVEIDPVIARLGREEHSEQPYQDERLTLVVDDARAYFERNTQKYDAIIFGYLDSQTLLSGLSSVRLDSFVYTLESFEQARSHLKENGVIVISFAAGSWVNERIGRMMAEVFGPENMVVYQSGVDLHYIAGLKPPQAPGLELAAWQPNQGITNLPLSTDDWPYLYLRARSIPDAYWQVLLAISAVVLLLMARSFKDALRPDWHFWLLGAAFLLVEFKSITEFALLFGTTWFVNTLAITGVLGMALLANLLVLWRKQVNLNLCYGLLFASLAVSYFFPLDALNNLGPFLRGLAGIGLLTLPMFFAGLIFSESLRLAGETARPLASNLGGSFAGGVLEYGSQLLGIKSLYLVAAGVYALALLVMRRRS